MAETLLEQELSLKARRDRKFKSKKAWKPILCESLLLFLPVTASFTPQASFSSRIDYPLQSAQRNNALSVKNRYRALMSMTNDESTTGAEDYDRDEDSVLELRELTSPEMVIGVTTQLSEESTIAAELAMGAMAPVNATAVADVKDVEVTVFPEELADAPSVSKILKFAVPAVGVWLCSPLLSLIDTSAVGLLSGTAQQAALNPAVAVTEYTALLIAFMYTGATNLVAASQEKDRGDANKPQTSRNFISALQLSGFVGTALGTALFGLSVPILRAIIGNDAIDPEVFSAALKYVRIRALGMPAAAIIGSAQAACLGMQDIKSPLYVLAAAAIVNFVGDVSFVGNAHPWIGGTAGAAWATIFSQYAAVVFFVQWLCHKPKKSDVRAKRTDHSTRGFLEGKFRGRDFFRLPSREKMADFTPYIIPVTSTQVGRVSSYVSMSHVISSTLGTTSMAAQQVIISIWNCLYPVGESLSLTAQSFVPAIYEKKPSETRARALRHTLFNLWKAGLVFGTGLFGAVMCIPLLNPFFTADPAVMSLVKTIVPLLLIIFSTLGLFTSSEGMLLGQRDLGFLGKSYATFFFVIPSIMLRVKKAARSGAADVSLRSVWTVFTSYQVFRTIVWMLRASVLQRRAMVGAERDSKARDAATATN